MELFSKSKWIWAKNSKSVDDYVEFVFDFVSGNGKCFDKILTDKNMINVSLSMKGYLYDALLRNGKFNDFILGDIKNIYGNMQSFVAQIQFSYATARNI